MCFFWLESSLATFGDLSGPLWVTVSGGFRKPHEKELFLDRQGEKAIASTPAEDSQGLPGEPLNSLFLDRQGGKAIASAPAEDSQGLPREP